MKLINRNIIHKIIQSSNSLWTQRIASRMTKSCALAAEPDAATFKACMNKAWILTRFRDGQALCLAVEAASGILRSF